MTTNLTEVYNWVMEGNMSLSLVAIVEGVIRGTQWYLRERYSTTVLYMANPQWVYTTNIMSYMEEKSEKGKSHRVHIVGNC